MSMSTKTVLEWVTAGLVVAFGVFIFMALLSGCASEPLTEEEIYEQQNARQLRIDQMHSFYDKCKAGGNTILHNHRGPASTAMRRNPYGLDPKWCRINELECVKL